MDYHPILGAAFVFFVIGVGVGAWLRGLTLTDSTADAGATPSPPQRQPPPSTPITFPTRPSATAHGRYRAVTTFPQD